MKTVKQDVVKMLIWEIGKSAEDSEKDFDRTVEYIQDTIDALKNIDRIFSRFEIQSGIIAQIRRSPMGIVVCMGPYNYPLNETFTTLIPALIMGNTVICKPAKLECYYYDRYSKIFCESFPKSVINIVYGRGITLIVPIMETGKVNVLAFIGTSKAAEALKATPHAASVPSMLRFRSENSARILPDAHLSIAVNECILGGLSFNGQRCTAIKAIFVHHSIV